MLLTIQHINLNQYRLYERAASVFLPITGIVGNSKSLMTCIGILFLLVIDVIADTILKRIPSSPSWGVCYLSVSDRGYFEVNDFKSKALDCATDTIIIKRAVISGYLLIIFLGFGEYGIIY